MVQFSCPFCKSEEPLTHEKCIVFQCTQYGHVAQHLRRTHKPSTKFQCPRCHERKEPGTPGAQQWFDSHVRRDPPCDMLPEPDATAQSIEQYIWSKEKTPGQRLDDCGKWLWTHRAIYGNAGPRPSPYYDGVRAIYDAGLEKGREEGYQKGYADGFKNGHRDGYKEGHGDGYDRGYYESCLDARRL